MCLNHGKFQSELLVAVAPCNSSSYNLQWHGYTKVKLPEHWDCGPLSSDLCNQQEVHYSTTMSAALLQFN